MGFQFESVDLKISLFADDVILLLSKHRKSLLAVYDIVHHFSQISYYKVNETKTQILGLHIPDALRQELQQFFPFLWLSEYIPYLGKSMPKCASSLFKLNYGTLLTCLPTDLYCLKSFELSTGGRRAALKMRVLPILLCFA